MGDAQLDTRLLRFRSKREADGAAALARDLLSANRAQEALEVSTAAAKVAPNDGDLMLVEGRARFATGDLLGAQAALLKAARALPQSKEPFRWLGEVLLKRGDPARASKVLERAKAIDSNDRTIQSLFSRAQRLANVAETAGSDDAVPEERTVVRSDLTEQLRNMTLEADRKGPALTMPAKDLDSFSEEDETTTGVKPQQHSAPPPDFEDDRTDVVAPADLAPHVAAAQKAPPPPAAKGTLAFGSPKIPPAKPTAPGRPAAKPASTAPFVASEDEIDDALGALGKKRPSSFPAAMPPAAKKPSSFPPPQRPQRADPSQRILTPFGRTPMPPPKAPAPQEPPARIPPPAKAPMFPEPAFRAEPPAPEPRPPAPSYPAPFAEPPEEPAWQPEAEDAIPQESPDERLGGSEREDVDAVLAMLRRQGLFEPPGAGESAEWAKRAEVKASMQVSGTKVGIWLGVVWVLAIGLAVGGWFGWQEWVKYRRAKAATLVETAKAEAYRGDHAGLVDAERHLIEAFELHPQDRDGPTLLLFVHAQRALEEGAFDAGYIRPTITRAERVHSEAAYLNAARAILSAAEGGHASARRRLAAALRRRPRDAAILYLAGRLEQRLGSDEALAHLEASVEGDEQLVAPRIALAEARYDEGRAEEALALLDHVLEEHDGHLRARLWRAYMTSDSDEPAAALSSVGEIQATLADHGAPTDHVLFHLTRARLLRRQSQADQAGTAVDEAIRAGADEPRLLALVATEARRAGRILRAEQAATTAVSGAPENADFRKLLAEIQIQRRNGRGALTTMQPLDAADPDVLSMRAEAALLVGTDEALSAAAGGLDAYVAGTEEPSVEVRALRIRTHARIGDQEDVLEQARALSTEAPGDPSVALALGEAALAARNAETAITALTQAVASSPEDAEAHYLLGRAKRMGGDAEGAEESLRRAVELTPEHTDARLALGGLLLDSGQYAEADALYTELASSSRTAGGQAVSVAGRLGRIEALIGLNRLDDAQVQLEGVREQDRQTPSARFAAARLALARGRAGEALTEVRPLATAEGASPAVLALYGDALTMADQLEPAGQAYTTALAQDASLPEALVGQGELAVRNNDGRGALEILERARQELDRRVRPPQMRARISLLIGRAHLLERDWAAAREALQAAAAIEGAPVEVHFYLGEALGELNDPGAQAAYERYLELAPQGSLAARARRAIR